MSEARTDRAGGRKRQRRRRKLIKPGLQLRLIGMFLGLTALSLVIQIQFVGLELARSTVESSSSPVQVDFISSIIWRSLAMSLVGSLPLTLAVGVLATFRIAGPVHRLETHLEAVARGEMPPPCQLRKGDELHDLCRLMNSALATARSEGATASRATKDEAA